MSQEQDIQPAYGNLAFDSVAFGDLANGVNPHFQCPICHFAWQPKLDLGTNFSATFDYNQKTNFTIPEHTNPQTQTQCSASNQTIALFIAVHKDAAGTYLIIQRTDAEGSNGINVNWSNPQ